MRKMMFAYVCLLVLLCSSMWAQTYQLLASPHQQYLDVNGKPLAGGKVYTYTAGTNTLQTSYKDNAGTPNTNPVILDSGGFATIYLDTSKSYKVSLQNQYGVPQWTVDNISGSGGTLSTVPLNSIISSLDISPRNRDFRPGT